MKKIISFIAITICMITFSACGTEEKTPTIDLETATNSYYTKEEVAQHNSPEDCWVIINDKVYDATGYDSRHPGDETYYDDCGGNTEDRFDYAQLGSQPAHDTNSIERLEKLYIGNLK